jgi:hypothetical protein
MQAPVVDRETAEAEVNAWLEAKKVFPSTIEDNQESIKILTESIMYGVLTFEPKDNSFTHKLLFPLGEDGTTFSELKYTHRVNDKMLQKFMKGVSARDADGRLNATIAALTNTARGIIEGLDTMDKKVSNAIAIFFF